MKTILSRKNVGIRQLKQFKWPSVCFSWQSTSCGHDTTAQRAMEATTRAGKKSASSFALHTFFQMSHHCTSSTVRNDFREASLDFWTFVTLQYYKFTPCAHLLPGCSPSLVKPQSVRKPSMFHPHAATSLSSMSRCTLPSALRQIRWASELMHFVALHTANWEPSSSYYIRCWGKNRHLYWSLQNSATHIWTV